MSTDQEKAKIQTNMMFDMTEKPLMEYISAFLEEPSDVIFKESLPNFVNPIIMKPVKDYKKKKYLKFSLRTVMAEEKYDKPDIKELMKYEPVRETIGFIFYSLKMCYASIVASSMINNKPLISTVMEIDEQNWSFQPVYKDMEHLKQEHLQNTLGKLIEMRKKINTFSEETQGNINTDYRNVMTQLAGITISSDVEEEEKKVNSGYTTKPRLVIVVDEMLEKDLPKPPKNNQADLAPVSKTRYADPN